MPTQPNRPGLAEACLTPALKEEDHTRRYARRQKRWLSRGLHTPRACAHCNSVVSSLQLTFALCSPYPPANNSAHSPACSPQYTLCPVEPSRHKCQRNVTRSQPSHKAGLAAQPEPLSEPQPGPCGPTPSGGSEMEERVQQPGAELRQGWQPARNARHKREKKILQQTKTSVLDLNLPKVQGCGDLNQQGSKFFLFF